MRIDKGQLVKIKLTADDIRCFLIVGDAVWCGQRNGTIQILDRKVLLFLVNINLLGQCVMLNYTFKLNYFYLLIIE